MESAGIILGFVVAARVDSADTQKEPHVFVGGDRGVGRVEWVNLAS